MFLWCYKMGFAGEQFRATLIEILYSNNLASACMEIGVMGVNRRANKNNGDSRISVEGY